MEVFLLPPSVALALQCYSSVLQLFTITANIQPVSCVVALLEDNACMINTVVVDKIFVERYVLTYRNSHASLWIGEKTFGLLEFLYGSIFFSLLELQ